MGKYDFKLDLESSNSLSIIIAQVDRGAKILEFGPADGRLTQYLNEELECTVDIVEIDEDAGKKAALFARNHCLGAEEGNIENYFWLTKYKNEKYNYIIFADVLEHLHNPMMVIKKSKTLLCDGGKIITSIPNIAHNSVIFNLLNNEFQYNSIGLLDNTHIHFFTYKSACEIFEKNDMVLIHKTATYKLDAEDEFKYSLNDANGIELEVLKNHPYGQAYQFILTAVNKKYYEENKNEIEVFDNIKENIHESIASLYLDIGNGYSEENRVKTNVFYGDNSIDFNVTNFSNIRKVRLDFIEKSKCIVKIHKIIIDGIEQTEVEISGNYLGNLNGEYYFNSFDPYIEITIHKSSMDHISFEFDLKETNTENLYDSYLERIQNVFELQLESKDEIIEKCEEIIRNHEKIIKNHEENIKNCEDAIKNRDIQINDNLLEIEKLVSENEKLKQEVTDLIQEHNIAENQIKLINNQLIAANQQLQIMTNQYEAILNSTIWRLTKPLRYIITGVRELRLLKKYVIFLFKGLSYLKRNGIKATIQKAKYCFRSNSNKQECTDVYNNAEAMELNSLPTLDSFNKSIAVHVHLYYVDLISEFISYLNNIPYSFDLFVSCKEDSDIENIKLQLSKIKNVKNIDIRITINRGRDIAPLYVQFGDKVKKYDYFLHIHTKKSLFTGKEQCEWRTYALDCLLENEEVVKKIFSLFESENNVGLFFPETFGDMHLIAHDWLANKANGQRLLEAMGIEFDDGLFNYPVGSFFWAKAEAVRPLFDLKLKYEDFPIEAGQTDGTIAHALERVLPFVVKKQGYKNAIHDISTKRIYLDKSLKIYQEYFSLTKDAVQYHLSQFEVITFDIFDTLITRYVLLPDDVFKIIQAKIERAFGLKLDFLKLRKRAEALAWDEKKEFTSIHDIYEQLSRITDISYDIAMQIKQIEIDTELEVCIPRNDMLEIFKHIKRCNRKIILISDMYLTSDIIKKILLKCGYEGYDDIWVSCEKGLRKDNDTLWPVFFEQYGQYNTIHVGDNPRSDIQLVGDKLRRTFYIMNPVTGFKLSKHYSKFKKYIDTSIESSLYLGMMVNGGLYNSPFSIQANGEPLLSNGHQFGYVGLGALFTSFVNWLSKKQDNNIQYLFLAREGFLFKKLYDVYCSNLGILQETRNMYFLTSRRAMSVASINNEDDVKEILSQYYKGSLANLVEARLGFQYPEQDGNTEVQMPNDIDIVISKIMPYMVQILDSANQERIAYKQYIESIANPGKKLVIVDVGYSGTIQYYFAKLMDYNIDGLYLCTWIDKKPEKLGCKCEALFPIKDASEQFTSKIFSNQLLLEAILKAPYGQLLYFQEVNGDIKPVYKDDNSMPQFIVDVQDGIIEFVNKYSSIIRNIKVDSDVNDKLSEDIFYEFSSGDFYSNEMSKELSVQDDYCSNGVQVYNQKEKRWIVN